MDDFGRFDFVQNGHPNVEEDNVRLHLNRFLDGLLPTWCLADDVPSRACL